MKTVDLFLTGGASVAVPQMDFQSVPNLQRERRLY